MLEKREHISVIVDEYGCFRGVVSMEDVIETMTGVEIVDEDDVAVDMQAFAKEKLRMMRAEIHWPIGVEREYGLVADRANKKENST